MKFELLLFVQPSCIFVILIIGFLLIWMEQALGIKGKMIAKKNYAEKAQMKRT